MEDLIVKPRHALAILNQRMLHNWETYLVVNDALKAETRFLQVFRAFVETRFIASLYLLYRVSSYHTIFFTSKSNAYFCGRELSVEGILATYWN